LAMLAIDCGKLGPSLVQLQVGLDAVAG